MRGIEVPERTEDFTADPVELFFDLAFVFAFSQLVGHIVHHPTWAGIGEAALLFGLLWLPWQQLTWSANAVSGNGRRVRIVFLIATAMSVPMAAATSTALDLGGPVFALSLSGIMALGFLIQTLSFSRETSHYGAVIGWVGPNLAAMAVLVVGAWVDGTGRTVLWIVSLAIVFGAMVAAGRGEWIIRSSHFAERHGLIVIIALGEVIVAIGVPVVAGLEAGTGVPGRTVAALVTSGAFAGLLWWGYFDRIGPALEHRAEAIEGDQARGRYVRDIYTWAHAPIVAGIILAAAALEEIAVHPTDQVDLSFRMMLLGGLALLVVGASAAIWRAFRRIPRERVASLGVLALLLASGSSIEGVVLLVAVVAVMAVTLAAEHVRIEG